MCHVKWAFKILRINALFLLFFKMSFRNYNNYYVYRDCSSLKKIHLSDLIYIVYFTTGLTRKSIYLIEDHNVHWQLYYIFIPFSKFCE